MEINRVYLGDCTEILKTFPDTSIDLIFADPPYNLQIDNNLKRPNEQKYDGVEDNWDKFFSVKEYDDFTYNWLKECQRVMKTSASIWVIGTYHNIYRMGKIMQDLGFWILNDIIWVKTNPTPNFKGTRFTNAHETILWAKKDKDSSYTFNYHAMKKFNDNKQMRSDWHLAICQGNERLKINGKKIHSTQKPEALLTRIILASSNTGDVVLDPFFGTGTTGAVAKKLKRNWIGIEKEKIYVEFSIKRIDETKSPHKISNKIFKTTSKRTLPKVKFSQLIEVGLIQPGDKVFSKDKKFSALVKADSTLLYNNYVGSIHKISAFLLNKPRHNGWDFWFVTKDDKIIGIDDLRTYYRQKYLDIEIEIDLDKKKN